MKYKTEVTRGLDTLPMLLSPAHTTYHHHQQQHMEAPNNGAANTLLQRPRLAQCGVATLLYLVLHCLIPEAFLPVYCISKQRPALYWLRLQPLLPSWSLAASRSARSTPLHQQLLQPSRVTVHAICTPSQALLSLCHLRAEPPF